MDNPSLILRTVDKRLNHPVRLVIYGRAALSLGFENSPPEAAKTQDVDAIISVLQEKELQEDLQFWEAVEGANAELKDGGLYMTHLFSEREVFLRKRWEENIVPVARPSLNWLQVKRLATIDLVLSKMMRGDDAQDMQDAGFMIRHDRIKEAQLLQAFDEMKPIELVELRDAFKKARPIVLRMARESNG
jgi:hypothetical protein